jgi:hypothetical protein
MLRSANTLARWITCAAWLFIVVAPEYTMASMPTAAAVAAWKEEPTVCGPVKAPWRQDHFADPLFIPCAESSRDVTDCVVIACMDGTAAAVVVSDGSVQWRQQLDAPLRGSPRWARAPDLIIFTTLQSGVVALTRKSGDKRWAWQAPQSSWIFDATVTVHEGNTLVAVGARDADLTILNAMTGSEVCIVTRSDGVWGPPVFLPQSSRASGETNVSVAFAMTASCIVGVASCGGTSASADRHVTATWRADIAPAGLASKYRTAYWIFSGPTVVKGGNKTSTEGEAGDVLVVGANDGALHGFPLTGELRGKRVWRMPVTGTAAISTPLVVSAQDSSVLIGFTEKGAVFAVAAAASGGDWLSSAPKMLWHRQAATGWVGKGRLQAACEAQWGAVVTLVTKGNVARVLVTATTAAIDGGVAAATTIAAEIDNCAGRAIALRPECYDDQRRPGATVVVACSTGRTLALNLTASSMGAVVRPNVRAATVPFSATSRAVHATAAGDAATSAASTAGRVDLAVPVMQNTISSDVTFLVVIVLALGFFGWHLCRRTVFRGTEHAHAV